MQEPRPRTPGTKFLLGFGLVGLLWFGMGLWAPALATFTMRPSPGEPFPPQGGAASGADARPALLLAGGDVLEPGTGDFRRADVLIQAGVISRVATNIEVPASCKRFDATGKFLVPGLIDMHVHLFRSPAARTPPSPSETMSAKFLYCGVTSLLDLSSPLENLTAMRASTDRHPRVFASGSMFTAAPSMDRSSWGSELGEALFEVDTAGEIERGFLALLPFHPDVIKVALDAGLEQNRTVLETDLLTAIIRNAHERGLPVAVHTQSLDESLRAIEAGADLLSLVVTDRPIPDSLLPRFRRVGVVSCLAALEGAGATKSEMRLLERGEPLLEQAVDPETLSAWKASTSPCEQATVPARRCESLRRAFAIAKENIWRLQASGVRILAGSNAGSPGSFPGVSMHRELELLVECGLTPREALRAATEDAGRALRRLPLGQLVAGAPADLLILAGNPLESISRTREIVAVVSSGSLVPRDDLASMIQAELPPRVPRAELADFEGPTPLATWEVLSDEALGGASRASLEILQGENNHFLRIEGTLQPAGFFGFAAAQTTLGRDPAPGTTWDLRPFVAITFLARGDGRVYHVEFPTTGVADRDPHGAEFLAPQDWTEIRIPFDALEQAGKRAGSTPFPADRVSALRFRSSPLPDQPPGPFRLELDGIRLVPRPEEALKK